MTDDALRSYDVIVPVVRYYVAACFVLVCVQYAIILIILLLAQIALIIFAVVYPSEVRELVFKLFI